MIKALIGEKCRNGNCQKNATTYVISEHDDHIFKYYFCLDHWLEVIGNGMLSEFELGMKTK